jgi:hypothetical protein
MQSANSRNRFDQKDSLELGEKAEARFVEIARRSGWKVSASSKDENIDEHWDYQIEKDQDSFKVEVKSAKRVHRNDDRIQFEYTWVGNTWCAAKRYRLAVRQGKFDCIRKTKFISSSSHAWICWPWSIKK